MAVIYFSKLNVSSKIYDLYRDKSQLQQILKDIYLKMDTDASITDEEIKQEMDSGNLIDGDDTKELGQNQRYKFISLVKDQFNLSVTGRLVKIFKGDNVTYDESKDDIIITSLPNNAAPCNFHFDIENEQIAFTTSNRFGYRQFNVVFKYLLETYFKEISFELILEKNMKDFREQINKLHIINSMEMIVIPPNANNDDIENLLRSSPEVEEMESMNAHKLRKIYNKASRSNEGLNPNSKVFNRMYDFVQYAYGDSVVYGMDAQSHKKTISSKINAPHTEYISDDEKDSLTAIKEKFPVLIKNLLMQKFGKHSIEEIKSISEYKVESLREEYINKNIVDTEEESEIKQITDKKTHDDNGNTDVED